MSQFHVSQIETHVRGLYEAGHWDPARDDVNNMSRLLALHAVNLVLGIDSDAQRTIEITDGGDDRGIDAVGVDPNKKLVVFVQSKWRRDGSGSMSLGDVLKFLDGVKALLGMKTAAEPAHASEDMRTAVRDLLKTPGARIRLITITTANDPLADPVEQPINDLLAQLNDLEDVEPLAEHSHLAQADVFSAIADAAKPTVDLDIQMLDWGRAAEPQKMFYGRVSAAEVAAWFADHGLDLFAENIRVVIPRSDINNGISQTIEEEPEKFAYYNNGITILAEALEVSPAGLLNREVGFFRLKGASVVNGAQTVSTLGAALGTESESQLGRAFVIVRCIEVPADEDVLGRKITRFANTQNEVSNQDFAFLDSQQHRLLRELKVIGLEYILRSAEVPKSKDPGKVIEVRSAAVALACASSDVGYAVVAKREVSRLFSDTSIYKALFNDQTDPLRLSRAVEIVRRVDSALDVVERNNDGIKAGIAVHGRRVIAHLIMRRIGDVELKNPSKPLEDLVVDFGQEVAGHVDALTGIFPANAYPGNVFKNLTRVNELLAAV